MQSVKISLNEEMASQVRQIHLCNTDSENTSLLQLKYPLCYGANETRDMQIHLQALFQDVVTKRQEPNNGKQVSHRQDKE